MIETIIQIEDARILQCSFGEEKYFLLYSGQAMFDVDKIIGDEDITAALSPKTKEGFIKLCKATAIMSEQAELARRYMGYEAEQPLDEKALLVFCSPQEKNKLYSSAIQAYCLGWEQDHDEKKKNEISRVLRYLKRKIKS